MEVEGNSELVLCATLVGHSLSSDAAAQHDGLTWFAVDAGDLAMYGPIDYHWQCMEVPRVFSYDTL